MPPALTNGLFVLLWSSAFVTVRIGLASFSPLAFVAVRQTLSAVLLVAIMLVLGRSWAPLRRSWARRAVAGILIRARR